MIKIPEPKTIVDLVKKPGILLMVFPWTSREFMELLSKEGLDDFYREFVFIIPSFKGQLGVPLTVYPSYLLCLLRDSWGL